MARPAFSLPALPDDCLVVVLAHLPITPHVAAVTAQVSKAWRISGDRPEVRWDIMLRSLLVSCSPS